MPPLVQNDAVLTFTEPVDVPQQGVVIVLPGRGESPVVYERFARRLAADAYRVHVLVPPSDDPAGVIGITRGLLAAAEDVPRVLVGSDAGAAFAAGLVSKGGLEGLDALVLAGLPVGAPAVPVADWNQELQLRTSCLTHRTRLKAGSVRPFELFAELPPSWLRIDPSTITLPVLGIHGEVDVLSPLAEVRSWYARLPEGQLHRVAGGHHDILNDQSHRSVAATIVLFLERLQGGSIGSAIIESDSLELGRVAA